MPTPEFVVDQVRNEPRLAARLAHRLEPIQHGRLERARIVLGMGPVPLAGDDVRHAVVVHIRQRDRVELRERDAVVVLLGLLAHELSVL